MTRAEPGTTARGGGQRAAVFLDKDGTLIVDVPYNVDPALVRLTDGALAGLQALHAAGFLMVVVSNQAGVARGLFAEETLGAVERRLRALLGAAGVPLAGFYYCPHHPDGRIERYAVACQCRKPAPGLIERAAREHGIDLGQSWLVGDILHDVEAGRRAGCRTVLLDVGHESEWEVTPSRTPDLVAANLHDAACQILGAARARYAHVPSSSRRRTTSCQRRTGGQPRTAPASGVPPARGEGKECRLMRPASSP